MNAYRQHLGRAKRRLPVLPPMQCDDGCGECCGIVPATEREFQAIAAYIAKQGIVPVEHKNRATCPLYIDGRCSIYPVRPVICQAFGHSEHLKCSRGYNVNVSERVVRKMVQRNGNATRLLHELLPGFAAQVAIASEVL